MAFDPYNHNSSDVEPDDDPPPLSRMMKTAGQASIERMADDAEYNRNRSKTTIKNLQFGNGAKSTIYQQSLWVNRFNAFRSDILGQRTDRPFTHVELIRFIDRTIDNIRIRSGKPAPSVRHFWSGCAVIISYGFWSWPDFTFGRHDSLRLRTFMGQCVDDKRLMRGRYLEKAYIGIATIARLAREYFRHWLDYGARNFDVSISRCLAIVLQSALCCRPGDIALSSGYTAADGFFLRYEHIDLYLDGDFDGTVTLAHVRAIVELAYCKGHKTSYNTSRFVHLRPLLADDDHYLCPITLLIIHALRHDLLMGGTTIQAVLDFASTTPRRRLTWKHPQRPVLTALGTKYSNVARPRLDIPATVDVPKTTLKHMGLISGVLTRLNPQAIRSGAAKDLRAIKDVTAEATSVENIGRLLGHTAKAVASGVTDDYVGDMEVDTYSLRAAAKPTSMRAPVFGTKVGLDVDPTTLARSTASELAPAVTGDQSLPKGAARHKQTSQRELPASATTTQRPALKRKAENALLSPVPARKNLSTPLRELSTNTMQRPNDDGASTSPSVDNGNDFVINTTIPRHLIDPRLLDQDALETMRVPQHILDDFSELVFPSPESGGLDDGTTTPLDLPDFVMTSSVERIEEDIARTNEIAPCLDVAVPSTAASTQRPDASAIAFIDKYSRYNVVCNDSFAIAWNSTEEGARAAFIEEQCLRGGSKDDPTPFTYHCSASQNCPYQTTHHHVLAKHQKTCTYDHQKTIAWDLQVSQMSAEERAARLCPHDGCDWIDPDPKQAWRRWDHMHSHEDEPQRCPDCPDSATIYKNAHALKKHRTALHGPAKDRWPTSCRHPDCSETTATTFSRPMYEKHLKNAHGLDYEAAFEYYPLIATTSFQKQECYYDNCTTIINFRNEWSRHLKNVHKLSGPELQSVLDVVEAKTVRYEQARPKRKRKEPATSAAPGSDS